MDYIISTCILLCMYLTLMFVYLSKGKTKLETIVFEDVKYIKWFLEKFDTAKYNPELSKLHLRPIYSYYDSSGNIRYNICYSFHTEGIYIYDYKFDKIVFGLYDFKDKNLYNEYKYKIINRSLENIY